MECSYHKYECDCIVFSKTMTKTYFPPKGGGSATIGIDRHFLERAADNWYKGDCKALHDLRAKIFCGAQEGEMRWAVGTKPNGRLYCQIYLEPPVASRVLGEKQELLQNNGAVFRLCHKEGNTDLYISAKEPELPDLFEYG